ncbi:MAG: DUF4189 domain-containing protein [Betaproteobacteria bacterium]|nr:DUF4189 domain-containing protein [Betaproteobacteria bacterium]
MKTFIFRIIAIFSVLLAAQNAFAYGAVAAVEENAGGVFRTHTDFATAMTQAEADRMAIESCNAGKDNNITADCTVQARFTNEFISAGFATTPTGGNVFVFGKDDNTQQAANTALFAVCMANPQALDSFCNMQFLPISIMEQDITTCPNNLIVGSQMCECSSGDVLVGDRVSGMCQTPTTCGINEMQAPNGIDCVCATGFTGNPGACVQIPTPPVNPPVTPPINPPVNPPTPPTTDNDKKTTEAVIGIMGIALFGILYNGGLTGGGEFGLIPDYTFSHNGGVMIHSYGGRLDYENDNFSAYYAAKKTAASGFVYSSGMAYSKDFWHADYNAKSEGETTNADISAGLKYQSGILQVQSGITAEYELTKTADNFLAGW